MNELMNELTATLAPEPAWAWEIDEAIELCRKLEKELVTLDYHCGLTGGTLRAGHSFKDLDIIIYPRKTSNTRIPSEILEYLIPLGITNPNPYDHQKYGDEKVVYGCKYDGRTIDIFFLK